MAELTYLGGYPEPLKAQVQQLIAAGKLGDVLAEGRGCAADHAKALDMFLREYMCDGYCGRHILHEIHD